MGFTITGAEIISFLKSHGFVEEGGGRHMKAVKDDLRIPIPVHRGDMKKGTANDILKRAGFSAEDIIAWRGKK
ncbi:hypothetical protein FACS1894216_13430 [Synergistales bacterium]|nr:hypothetical protein FACS1894216_13430 [Synergistales bacterium]